MHKLLKFCKEIMPYKLFLLFSAATKIIIIIMIRLLYTWSYNPLSGIGIT